MHSWWSCAETLVSAWLKQALDLSEPQLAKFHDNDHWKATRLGVLPTRREDDHRLVD